MNPCQEEVGVISFLGVNIGTITERFHSFWKKDEKTFFMRLDMVK